MQRTSSEQNHKRGEVLHPKHVISILPFSILAMRAPDTCHLHLDVKFDPGPQGVVQKSHITTILANITSV